MSLEKVVNFYVRIAINWRQYLQFLEYAMILFPLFECEIEKRKKKKRQKILFSCPLTHSVSRSINPIECAIEIHVFFLLFLSIASIEFCHVLCTIITMPCSIRVPFHFIYCWRYHTDSRGCLDSFVNCVAPTSFIVLANCMRCIVNTRIPSPRLVRTASTNTHTNRYVMRQSDGGCVSQEPVS